MSLNAISGMDEPVPLGIYQKDCWVVAAEVAVDESLQPVKG